MDQSTLVDCQIEDGRRFLERFAADGHPVRAAFWAKSADEGLWFLYVVTELYDREGPAASYRAVEESLRKLDELGLRGSEIKVIGPTNPVFADVQKILNNRLTQRGMDILLGERTLGTLEIEQGHIYPPRVYTMTQPNPMTSEDIGQEIVKRMYRAPSTSHPSRISLKNGTRFDGVPFSLQLGHEKALVAQFIEDGASAPRVVRLDEIASIV